MATKKDQKDQTNHEEKTDQHEPSAEKEGQEDSSLNDTEDADEGASEASPEERIALLEAELAQQKDKYLRMFADFDNAKRRHAREKQEWFSTAGKDVILDILPVVDDFERAMQMETSEANADEKLESEGVQLIYQKLAGVLKKRGIEAIDAYGTPFDDALHEALTEIPADPEMKGKVVDVVEKGYTMNGKLIRHAKVVVGK
ncbi:MAG: nucleotide exchange factor GrpE [Chitinophagales bacterium]